jgi:hypothetical protein
MTQLRLAAAWLAVCALLMVTTVSVLPGHDHDDAARPCSICQSGHLPCLQASVQIQVCGQMPVVWHSAPDNCEHRLDRAWVIRSPRAPPV